jgi:CHAT domain-containing protein
MALRAVGAPLSANEPFVGFGDPVLQGSGGAQRGPVSRIVRSLVLGTDTKALRSLEPLPETQIELKQFAAALAARPDSLFFRERATESTLKRLELSRFRIVAFATHGLLAGEFNGLAEPALVLTPPDRANLTDDGLLTASEIALLRLNADWVVLSACNTAAPVGRPGAEGLSGLAKAFFYAGSRALLVSHWWVHSEASVSLTTGAVSALTENPRRGRAEALRLAMLRLLESKTQPVFAHPVYWAPFVTVGEGG